MECVLRRPGVLVARRRRWRLPLVQVELHPAPAGGVRRGRVGVVRRVHVRVLHFSGLRGRREPVVVRYADGARRAGAEWLAAGQGVEAIHGSRRPSRAAVGSLLATRYSLLATRYSLLATRG